MEKLSIITPLYNTPKRYLEELVNQLIKYSNRIELVLVNDSPANDSFKTYLHRYNKYDFIKIIEHNENKGIFEAYKTGYLAATGKYCCILDHDDVFDPRNVLTAIKENPDVDLFYTDEYKFSEEENGNRFKENPYQKPDFDILSAIFYLYTHHVTVVRTAVIQEKLSCYNNELNLTSIFDINMLLEYMDAFVGKNFKVMHINKPDYGWRIHPNSTAMNLSQKLSGYYERLKKVEQFFVKNDEMPCLRINPYVGYVVDGFFLSLIEYIGCSMDEKEFRETLNYQKKIVGSKYSIYLIGDDVSELDAKHYVNVIKRIPIKYLQRQNINRFLIPSFSENGMVDEYNYTRHAVDVPFLSDSSYKVENGVLIIDNNLKHELSSNEKKVLIKWSRIL